MRRCNTPDFDNLRERLSARAQFIDAAEQLRTLLFHSTPSLLVSVPETLISLVEVAKGTLKDSGISLHTFSSCPDYLSPYKSAYFSLLLQLQAHGHKVKLNSVDLQVRLARLLFPLSTQLRVSAKASRASSTLRGLKDARLESPPAPSAANIMCPEPALSSGDSSNARHTLLRPVRPHSPSNLPSNAMLPPPAPLHRRGYSAKGDIIADTAKQPSQPGPLYYALLESLQQSEHTRTSSRDRVNSKRRRTDQADASACPKPGRRHYSDYASKSPHRVRLYKRHSDDGDSSSGDEDAESEPDDLADDDSGHGDDADADMRPVIPSRSPLKRSFGIFFTGKGRNACSEKIGQRFKHNQTHFRYSASEPQTELEIDS